MSGINKVILIGNLGKDPEIKHTASGAAIVNATLATNESWKGKDGERQERTEWHRLVFFGKLAEIVGEYLTKGSQIYVEGRIQTRTWEDNEGKTRYTTEIVGNNMQMLGSKGGSEQSESAPEPRQAAPRKTQQAAPTGKADPEFDDDIPF